MSVAQMEARLEEIAAERQEYEELMQSVEGANAVMWAIEEGFIEVEEDDEGELRFYHVEDGWIPTEAL